MGYAFQDNYAAFFYDLKIVAGKGRTGQFGRGENLGGFGVVDGLLSYCGTTTHSGFPKAGGDCGAGSWTES
jgi:hypothetical protein